FGQMPQGALIGSLFFALVALAALGSTVALLEPVTAWLVQRRKWRRPLAALVPAVIAWLGGLVSTLSFGRWADVRPGGRSLFAWIDLFTADLLLPLGAVLIALVVGFRMRGEGIRDELYAESHGFYVIWRSVLRYIAAPAMIVILIAGCYQLWQSLG
ncbi:MAG: sodium-dependent transporter, partial [Spongiibacteraceae bacterium]|nr:sodium-dependent transporter [Spongiibacteraceae bacterium]